MSSFDDPVEIHKIQNLFREVHNHIKALQSIVVLSVESPSYQEIEQKVIKELETAFSNIHKLERVRISKISEAPIHRSRMRLLSQ